MHYYVASDGTFQAESDMNMAWHAGNSYYNANFIGIEACQSMGDLDQFKRNEAEAIKLAAKLCKKYGIIPNTNTIVLHRQVSSTACPHRSADIHGDTNGTLNYFISEIKRYMNGGSKPDSKPKESTYYHSKRMKKLTVIKGCGIYDGVALTKAKKLADAKVDQTYKVVDVWKKGNEPEDMSRFKIEYAKGKTGWITGNDQYITSAYYLNKEYSGKRKIVATKSGEAYEKNDLSGKSVKYTKDDVFTVVDNVTDKAGYPRLKLKSGLYVTALKSHWKFIK